LYSRAFMAGAAVFLRKSSKSTTTNKE